MLLTALSNKIPVSLRKVPIIKKPERFTHICAISEIQAASHDLEFRSSNIHIASQNKIPTRRSHITAFTFHYSYRKIPEERCIKAIKCEDALVPTIRIMPRESTVTVWP